MTESTYTRRGVCTKHTVVYERGAGGQILAILVHMYSITDPCCSHNTTVAP